MSKDISELGHLFTGVDEVIYQPDLCKHLRNIRVVSERFEIEGWADRRSEEQVLRYRSIEIESVNVVGLDEVCDAILDKAPRERIACFEKPPSCLRIGFGVEPAAKAKSKDGFLKVDAG